MAEGQELPPLSRPVRTQEHANQVKSYIQQGAPEPLARKVVAKDILAERREQRVSEWKERAMIDALTGAFNRRYFDEQLKDVLAVTQRQASEGLPTQFGVLIFDLDRFKTINDRFSHGEGDRVLKSFTDCMQGLIREEDVFARYGGEEFALIIRQAQKLSPEALALMVERYRTEIAATVKAGSIGEPKTESVTASIGLVLFPNGAQINQPEDLTLCADKALYQAKAGGRNQAVKFMGVDSDGAPQFSKVEVSPKG